VAVAGLLIVCHRCIPVISGYVAIQLMMNLSQRNMPFIGTNCWDRQTDRCALCLLNTLPTTAQCTVSHLPRS